MDNNNVKIFLTKENIKDALEFVDADGDTWYRNVEYEWRHRRMDGYTDYDMITFLDYKWMNGAYVTKWKPGCDPKAPLATQQSNGKWVKGYVTVKGDIPPVGTVLWINETTHFRATSPTEVVDTGWVVVKEAPPEENPWRRVVVEVCGNGDDAVVILPTGRAAYKQNDWKELTPSAIAKYATPAPDRKHLKGLLDALCSAVEDAPMPRIQECFNAVLDYVCPEQKKC